MVLWGGLFAAIGLAALFLVNAATPVTVDPSIPNPTNVKAFADDRTVTVTWEPPSDMSGIVGYYITWGTQSGGVYTNAKQTTHSITQIQPLTNGVAYNVKVQSVRGNYTNVATPGAHDDETATEARANGRVSTGATTTITPSSARVDQLRQQMTGFFDDFNLPAGPLDELKWNTAGSSCTPPGTVGAFINSQFHAHSQARSSFGDYSYCDRGQAVNRPRGVFDITGKTESNPGVITFDFDGVTMSRDAWYIDLIPVTARKNGIPVDVTSHSSIFDDDVADPTMLRIIQGMGSIGFSSYDNNKNPQHVEEIFVNCPDFKGDLSFDGLWCGGNFGTQRTDLSPLPEPPIDGDHPGATANVRRHWRVEISPTKIKLFVDGYKMLEAEMPANLANVKQWYVHNNIFSYNTGKDTPDNPTTALLHWDNFGFNGPAQSTVTHNYQEGGVTGTQPYLGRGLPTAEVPEGNRDVKVNVPDPIASPVKARLMFTFGSFGWSHYSWTSDDHIVVNGKRYNYPDPRVNSVQPPVVSNNLADAYVPFADGIAINPADLKQGVNDIQLNLTNEDPGAAIMNVHLELEYTKGTEPSFTQPKDIFGATNFLAAIQPIMSSHDNYLFVEQDMGLPTGVIASAPGGGDTTPPTVSITSPTNGTSFTKGASLPILVNASDNIGVDKVELLVNGSLNTTITHSPFNHTLDTSNWATGTHTVRARAYDTAGNSTLSTQVSITITSTPTDATPPTVSVTAPTAGQTVSGTFSVSATASDTSGISGVSFHLDGNSTAFAIDTSSPYSISWNSADASNGAHTITAKATDGAGNVGTSSPVSLTVSNVVPDTTAPTVNITSPVIGAIVPNPTAVNVNASDNIGVSKVELIVDGVTLTPADTNAPFSFSWNTSGYAAGSHTLRTRATDAAGNIGLSAIITVTIPDTISPSTGLSAPLNGTTVSGTVNVMATATDNVGVSRVEFLVDGSIVNTDTSGPSYGFSWSTTSLTNAAHTLQSKVYDAAGNIGLSAIITVNVNNTPNPPTTPPTPKTGDVNGDSKINVFDLQVLLSNWGRRNATRGQGNLNTDTVVNIFDLQILLNNWGK